LGAVFINARIPAVRKLAVEAADNGLLTPELANGITRVKGVASKGVRLRNWLTARQAQALLNAPDATTNKDGAGRSLPCFSVVGFGAPKWRHFRSRVSSRGRPLVHRRFGREARTVCTVPMPTWVRVAIDAWASAAGIIEGPVFRSVNRAAQSGTPP
jgi:hypothetical protein